jgi:hypothetical protein
MNKEWQEEYLTSSRVVEKKIRLVPNRVDPRQIDLQEDNPVYETYTQIVTLSEETQDKILKYLTRHKKEIRKNATPKGDVDEG